MKNAHVIAKFKITVHSMGNLQKKSYLQSNRQDPPEGNSKSDCLNTYTTSGINQNIYSTKLSNYIHNKEDNMQEF